MKDFIHKTLSILLTFVLCFFAIPAFAFASDEETDNTANGDLEQTQTENDNAEGANIADTGTAQEAEDVETLDAVTIASTSADAMLASANPVSIDIVFLVDSTGSMSSYISAVRANLEAFATYLSERGADLRIGLIDFKDITADGINSTTIRYINGNKWTSDIDALKTELASITVNGGGDNAETPTDALSKLISDESGIASLYDWRTEACKFAFVLTDADYKDSDTDSSISSMEKCIRGLSFNSIHTTVVSKTAYEERYASLYKETDGRFFDISSSNYYTLMNEYAEVVFDQSHDTDGDGLLDEWEINGYDYDGDGVVDVHLEQMGADPNVPDIFVEIDWMEALWPQPDAMKMVVEQFKNHGINLHIDAGYDSIDYVTGNQWKELAGGNQFDYASNFDLGDNYENWNQFATEHFNRSRWSIFRYCLFVNRYNNTSSSGIAENIPGQFFIVADVNGWILGDRSESKTISTAGTFMHELGHTLNLKHGGSDHERYKPNNLSVMNYFFQTSGLVGTNEVNYSEYELGSLNEYHLNENDGIDPSSLTAGTGLGTRWFTSSGTVRIDWDIAGKSLDFNGNFLIESDVAVNLNLKHSTTMGILTASVNEWEQLRYKGGLVGGYGKNLTDSTILIEQHEEIAEELEELDYDTAVANELLTNPTHCSIQAIAPRHIYQDIDNQKLYVTVANYGASAAKPTLSVESELLDSPYSTEIDIAATQGSLQTSTVAIPVNADIAVGEYEVTFSLASEDGTTQTQEITVSVEQAKTYDLAVGETGSFLDESVQAINYTWTSDNEAINVNESGETVAVSEGRALITGTSLDNDIIMFYVDSRTNKDDICIETTFESISVGEYELYIDGVDAGLYSIIEYSDGFALRESNSSQYVALVDDAVTLSDEIFIWNYDGNSLSTTVKHRKHRLFFWESKYSFVDYYLSMEDGNLDVSQHRTTATIGITVPRSEHEYTYITNDDGTHSSICVHCGSIGENHSAHEYDDVSNACICGKLNPAVYNVYDVNVSTETHSWKSGHLWWKEHHTEYIYNISALTNGLTIDQIEYSLDWQYTWMDGSRIASKDKLELFYIRITDSNGEKTLWQYENGEVTPISS